MSEKDTITSSASLDPAKRKISKNILLALLMVLILGGIVAATFLYQHTKLKNVYSKNPNTSSTKQKSQAGLNNSGGKAVTYAQSSLDITLTSAKYVKPNATNTNYGATAFLGIDLTIYNPTDTNIVMATELFKLKSTAVSNYPVYPPKFVHNSSLPTGYTRLLDQTIKAKETLKGVVIFILPNNSLNSFTFSNGPQTFPVNVTK